MRVARWCLGRHGERACWWAVGLITAAIVTTGPSAAQVRVGADLTFATRYEWRGLLRRDGAVAQPSASVTLGQDSWLTAGAFVTVELSGPSPPDGVGLGRVFGGETNLWVEAAAPAGPLDLAVGWIGYFYDTDDALGATARLRDTHELYGRMAVIDLPVIVPQIRGFWDIDEAQGAYFEGSLGIRLPVWGHVLLPIGSLTVTPHVGVSAGQAVNAAEADELAYFTENGITHWGITVRLPVAPILLGPVTASGSLALQTQWLKDASTRVAGSDSSLRSRSTWFEAVVSVVLPRCRPSRSFCPS